jgi:hypothetical protein
MYLRSRALAAMSFVNPIILPFLIAYVNDMSYPVYSGFIYIFCIFIAQMAGSVFYYYGQFRSNIAGMNVSTINNYVSIISTNLCQLDAYCAYFGKFLEFIPDQLFKFLNFR